MNPGIIFTISLVLFLPLSVLAQSPLPLEEPLGDMEKCPPVGEISNMELSYRTGFTKLFEEYKTSQGFEEYIGKVDYQKSQDATAFASSITSSEEFAVFYSDTNLTPEEEKLMIQISAKYLEFLRDGKSQLSSYTKTDYSEKKNEIDAVPVQDSGLTMCGEDKMIGLEELEKSRDLQKFAIKQLVDPIIADWEKNLELKQSKFPAEFPKEQLASSADIITDEIGLKKGDWVKYKVDISGNGSFGIVNTLKSNYEFAEIGCVFSDVEWNKFEIIETDNNNPTIKSSIFCNGEEHEHPLANDSFTFIQYFIPINVKIGDIFTDADNEYEVVGFETAYFDDKEIDVIKLHSEQIELYDNDGKMKITDESLFEKNSGLLLEKSTSMEATNMPFFGDMSVSVKLDAVDYNIPRTDPGQSSEYPGGSCLVATATYGSELAPQVQQLRELRDNSLLQTESGTLFMKYFNDFYYSFSPVIADYERENPVFREAVKIAITPMIASMSILEPADMDSEAKVLGYGISLIILNVMMYAGIPAIVIVGIKKRIPS